MSRSIMKALLPGAIASRVTPRCPLLTQDSGSSWNSRQVVRNRCKRICSRANVVWGESASTAPVCFSFERNFNELYLAVSRFTILLTWKEFNDGKKVFLSLCGVDCEEDRNPLPNSAPQKSQSYRMCRVFSHSHLRVGPELNYFPHQFVSFPGFHESFILGGNWYKFDAVSGINVEWNWTRSGLTVVAFSGDEAVSWPCCSCLLGLLNTLGIRRDFNPRCTHHHQSTHILPSPVYSATTFNSKKKSPVSKHCGQTYIYLAARLHPCRKWPLVVANSKKSLWGLLFFNSTTVAFLEESNTTVSWRANSTSMWLGCLTNSIQTLSSYFPKKLWKIGIRFGCWNCNSSRDSISKLSISSAMCCPCPV